MAASAVSMPTVVSHRGSVGVNWTSPASCCFVRRSSSSWLTGRCRKSREHTRQRQRRGSSVRVVCGEKDDFVDTRIHYSSRTEGWIGGEAGGSREYGDGSSSSSNGSAYERYEGATSDARELRKTMGSDMLRMLLQVEGSHYKFLNITPSADLEEVKAAYRRLSKLYHPDSTDLPLELAAQKFMRLKEAYQVLSNVEQRRLYDWKLAQELSSKAGGRFVWPYEVDKTQKGPGSKASSTQQKPREEWEEVELTDQAYAALAFDAFAFLVAVMAILYAVYVKGI